MMASRYTQTIWMLAAAIAGAGAFVSSASAQNPWRGIDVEPPPGEIEPVDTTAAPQPNLPEPDWSLLNTDDSPTAKASLREKRSSLIVGSSSSNWTSNATNGAEALAVNRTVTPFWDTRVGADLNVANQPAARSASDAYRNQFGYGTQATSSGTAWAAMTAPGVASVWDKTSIEARVDPGSDQTKLGTSLSKSVPIAGNQYSLALQSGYNVIQQGNIPAIGYNGRPTRSYETDQQARLNITDTGTSLIAGQTLATTDDKWLRSVGAEQKLFGGVNISGTISETTTGVTNKTFSAGFKHSW
jgi:hypothetical protein